MKHYLIQSIYYNTAQLATTVKHERSHTHKKVDLTLCYSVTHQSGKITSFICELQETMRVVSHKIKTLCLRTSNMFKSVLQSLLEI